MRLVLAALMAGLSTGAALAQANITASILPSARSVTVGNPATAFAAVTNLGDAEAQNCRLALLNGVDASFSYQTTTPANVLSGTPDTPVNIAAGATQNFLFSLTPNSVFSDTTAIIDFVCDNSVRATYRPGLTEFVLSSDNNAPDILAIGSTISGDGVARVSAPTGFVPFAVSAINIGSGNPGPDINAPATGNNEATITVRPENGALELPIVYDICEANASSVCIGPRGASVTAQIGDQPSFFVVRALGQNAGIPLLPDVVRTDVVFEDAGGIQRGRTSVALTVTGRAVNPQTDNTPSGIWQFDVSGPAMEHGEIFQGTLVVDGAGGVTAYSDGERYGQNDAEYGFFGEFTADASASPSPTFGGVVQDIYDNNAPATGYLPSGTWQPENEIRGNLNLPTDLAGVDQPQLTANTTRRIRAVYSLLTRRAVTQAGIAGTYDLVDEDNGALQDIGDIIIDAQGNMTGSVSDGTNTCQTTGMITQVNASQNIFFVDMSLSGACQYAAQYSGHAAQTDDADLNMTNGLAMIFANQNALVNVALVPDAQFP